MRILRKISRIFTQLSRNSKKKTKSIKRTDFLDLNTNIQNFRFQTKLYDKQDNFNFSIIRMPYKSISIIHKKLYSTMSAEILRICNARTKFQKSAKILIGRIMKQMDLINQLKKPLLKLFNSHEECS